MKKLLLTVFTGIASAFTLQAQSVGETVITRWPDGKAGAVSITFDDGSVNQFRQALPILNKLGMKGTFFIITGQIPGSKYHGKFIGRSMKDIIAETATMPTNGNNIYERASAAGYLGLLGGLDAHYEAGSLIDDEKPGEAYKIIDDFYRKVRNKELKAGIEHNTEYKDAHGTTWADIRRYAAQGHEFASHMITHPRLAALDEANMLYELKSSREEIRTKMGERYTFSGEGPFGTENERVMQYAYKLYPALRNRMPEPWLKEISRGNKSNPGVTDKEYVQLQRGATTKTPMPMMKSWVDTTRLGRGKTWLVLTFHGVDGIGWEPLTHQELNEYFSYIKAQPTLWVATFGDATRYMRERQAAKTTSKLSGNSITVSAAHKLNASQYSLPLTFKTYVPATWKKVSVAQSNASRQLPVISKNGVSFVLYTGKPNGTVITVKKI